MFHTRSFWLGFGGLIVVALLAGLSLGGLPLANAQDGRPFLGVRFENTENGARIIEVRPDSPAEAAGLQPGDLITAINGETLNLDRTLVDVFDSSLAPGDTITLSVERDGETLEMEATLVVRPADLDAPSTSVEAAPGSTQQFYEFGGARFARLDEGWRVESIGPDSAAETAGLEVGDLVVRFNDTPVAEVRLGDLVMLAGQGGDAALSVERDGASETLDLTLTLEAGSTVQALQGITITTAPGEPAETPEGDMQVVPVQPVPVVPLQTEQPGYLGVSYLPLSPETIEQLESEDWTVPVEEGGFVMEVSEDTPAAEAGLQPGDVITAVNGEPVDQERTLSDRIYAYEAGDTITLDVARGDETLSLDVTLAERPAGMGGFGLQIGPLHGLPDADSLGGMLPFGMFLNPDFDLEQFLEEHPALRERLGDLDPEALNELLEDLRGELGITPDAEGNFQINPDFDWQQFLEEHPNFADLLERFGSSIAPDEWERLLPEFPWFGESDPFHQNVDPLEAQPENNPA